MRSSQESKEVPSETKCPPLDRLSHACTSYAWRLAEVSWRSIWDSLRFVESEAMHRDALQDELRRLELDVVEGEHQLAEHEALVVARKRQGEDVSEAESVLEMMRQSQRRREQDRQRLLSLLHP
jgi:hypothetical protein